MRLPRALLLALPLLLAPSISRAGQVWTDGNGDGLPDTSGPLPAQPSEQVTVSVYLDSQSFVWTNYQVWLDRDPGLTFVSQQYIITGGTNGPLCCDFPPSFTGWDYPNVHGVSLIGTMTFHVGGPGPNCVTPIIDPADPNGTFSVLGTQTAYFLFQTAGRTCWSQAPTATEPTTWGRIKGIYR